MADKKINLEFQAKVSTDVGNVKTIIANLKNELGKLQIPAGATKGFEHSLNNLNREVQEFEALLAGGVSSLNDTRKLETSWKRVTTILDTIGVQIKDLGLAGDKIFPKSVTTNIEKANKAMTAYQQKVAAIRETQEFKDKQAGQSDAVTKRNQAQANLAREEKRLRDLQVEYDSKKAAWDKNRATEYAAQQSEIAELTTKINQQTAALEQQKEVQKQLAQQGVVTQKGEITDRHSKALPKVDAEIARLKEAKRVADEAKKAAEAEEEAAKKAQSVARGKVTKAKNKHGENSKEVKEAGAAKVEAENRYAEAHKKTLEAITQVEQAEKDLQTTQQIKADLQKKSQEAEDSKSQVDAITKQKEALEKQRDALQTSAQEHERYKVSLDRTESALEDQKTKVETYRTALSTATTEVQRFNAELEQLELDGSKTEWEEIVRVVKEFTGVDLSGFQGDMSKVTSILEQYKMGEIQKSPETMKRLAAELQKVIAPAQGTKQAINGLSEEFKELNRAEQDMERLKNQVLDFFSLSNAIQIFKNAIRDAFETVKELDAAMTETAVVTDFSVGDMWDKLPEYSEQATQLGTSIKSLYEATTLYYQQGLKSEAAMGVGIETMKMARIANMDAAAATEAMTAALRGFNMEINETSATRINDVYSELAAITASDTEQIATAMSKTASIAASANMEFETTAALLAQIIETTQEAPETAGTAMKTIIARFTEVKQLFSEGMLTGEDGEGEEININKIDAALKTVGISLKDFLNGTKGIDDIFLELASKWNSLDLATQRYIATTAAGSRQQSRFIAMMSNYDRTMELVEAANNSAGASSEQFGKTLESLDAKLQKLQNAWDTFTMGLANNQAIKIAVDMLTGLLNIVNDLTGALGDGIGVILKLGAAFGAMKLGKSFLGALTIGLNPKNDISTLQALGMEYTNLGKAATETWEKMKANKIGNWTSGISAMIGLVAKLTAEVGKQAGWNKQWTNSLETVATAASTAAVAIQFLNMVGLSNPYFAIATAIAALGYAIYKITSDISHAKSIEGQIEAAEEQTRAAESAANDAREAYMNLFNMGNSYTDTQERLAELTEGTEEYTRALIDANNQVLAMIEAYPGLQKYLRMTNGVLSFDESGYQQYLADLESGTVKTQTATIAARASEAQLRYKEKQQEIGIDFTNWISNESNHSVEDLDKIFEFFSYGSMGLDYGSSILALRLQEAGNLEEGLAAYANQFNIPEETLQQFSSFITEKWTQSAEGQSYFNRLEESRYNVDSLNNQMARDIVDNSIISDEGTESVIAKIIADKIAVGDEVQSEVDLIKDKNLEQLQEMYKEVFGIDFSLVADSYMTDGEVDREKVINAIATERARSAYANQAKDLEAGIEQYFKANPDNSDAFKALLAGETNDGNIIDKILQMGGDSGELSVEKILGEFDIDALAEILDTDAENIKTQLTVSLNKFAKMRVQLVQDLAGKLAEGGLQRDAALQYANKLTFENATYLNEVASALQQGLGEGGLTALNTMLQEGLSEHFFANQKEISEVINSINFNNPIQAVGQLTRAFENGSDTMKTFVNNILAINQSTLGLSAQFKYLLTTAEFGEIKDDIADMVKETGRVDAKGITELAEECDYLNDIMEQTGITAEGMAKALTMLEDGTLEVNQLTDAVLASFKAFDGLESIISSVHSKFEDFNTTDRQGEIQDFVNSAAEQVKESIEMGAWGNELTFDYLAELFGTDFVDAAADDLRGAIEKYNAVLQELGTGSMSAVFERLARGKDVLGNTIKGATGSLQEGYTYTDENGKSFSMQEAEGMLTLDGYQNFSSSAEFVDFLANTAGMSEAGAKAALAWWSNYSTDMREYFAKADEQIARTEFIEALGGVVDQSEIDAYASIWNLTTEQVEALNAELAEAQIRVTDFYEESGKLKKTEDIMSSVAEAMAEDGRYGGLERVVGAAYKKVDGITQIGENIQLLNLDSLFNYLREYKVPEGAWDGIIEQLAEGADQVTQTIQGHPITVDITPDMSVADINAELQNELQRQLWREQAEIQAQVYGELEVAPTLDETAYNSVQSSIDKLTTTRYAKVVVNEVWGSRVDRTSTTTTTVTVPAGNSGYSSTAQKYLSDRGYISVASGTKSAKGGISLLSEEGAEIVWNKEKGYSYITGQNGPEFQRLNPGDQVFNAKDTKKILKNGINPTYASHASGTFQSNATSVPVGAGKNPISGGSGGNASEKEEDKWENPFDKLYNLVRKIDEELRQRERIERRYEKLLEDIGVSANKIVAVTAEELVQLERERMLQEQLISGRRYQIQQFQNENPDLTGYANVVQNERGEDVLRINWDLINGITDSDQGQRIEDYVSQLEEWFDDLQEAEDALWDIEDTIDEIKERGKDQYFELEDMIKDALTQSYQEQIDTLTEINNSINDTNASLLDAIQKSVDKQRQDRENERTEDELAEKQRRLMYLQQDTSGANAMEILRLQDEIAQGQEDYTDTLIDQKISELQDQNDAAAEQRDKQITLAQAQLDHYIETGRIWQEVQALMDEGLDKDNGLIRGTRLETILKNAANFKGLSDLAKVEWLNDTNKIIAEALAYLDIGEKLDEIIGKIDAPTVEGPASGGTMGPPSSGGSGGSGGSGSSGGGGGSGGSGGSGTITVTYGNGNKVTYDKNAPNLDSIIAYWESQWGKSDYNGGTPTPPSNNGNSNGTGSSNTGNNGDAQTEKKPKQVVVTYGNGKVVTYNYPEPTSTVAYWEGQWGKVKNRVYKYKQGGLADFTGPAWLDGTKARPELVLNARDTQNFIQLKDILASLMNGSINNTSTENNGDITYDIDINVESIGSDYDIEQVANKVKSLIGDDARYRNNNTVSLKR